MIFQMKANNFWLKTAWQMRNKTMLTKEQIGQEVIERRKSLGLSRERMAMMIGCTRNQIESVEKASSNYTIELYLKIINFLNQNKTS
jgi:DNA-binding XRE family transcriptional regulator